MNDQSETIGEPGIGSANLPAVCASPTRQHVGDRRARHTRPDASFAAHMLGATGQRRGLKGGAPVLQAARRAYLEAEWSGRDDRRTSCGAMALTRI